MIDCENALLRRWCLRIGPDSKEFMTSRAYQSSINIPDAWSRPTTLKCLGHQLDDDAGMGSCFDACASAMCRSFYANLTASLLWASEASKYKLLTSCVRKITSFRWSRWLFARTYAAKLDSLQRKFLTSVMQVKPKEGEPFPGNIPGGIFPGCRTLSFSSIYGISSVATDEIPFLQQKTSQLRSAFGLMGVSAAAALGKFRPEAGSWGR